MKNKIMICFCMIIVFATIGWFLFSYEERVEVKSINIGNQTKDNSSSIKGKIDNKNKNVLEDNKEQKIPHGLTKKGWERILKYDKANRGANSVIDFYGKIVDQYGSGIPDVNVELHVSGYNEDFISKILKGAKKGEVKGTFKKRIEVKSNVTGFFFISNERGQFLRVTSIQKEGYTPPSRLGENYIYKSNYGKRFDPSPESPISFTMWKNSLSKENLNSFHFKIKLRGDGSQRSINLITGRLSDSKDENDDIFVSIKSDIGEGEVLKKYNWRLLVKAANGGGFTETTDAFLFLAPESGYVDNYEVFMEKRSSEWSQSINDRKIYFKGKQGQLYAALKLTAYAFNRGNAVVLIDAVVNSSGSRNLEKR
jgi:hypothetical protein